MAIGGGGQAYPYGQDLLKEVQKAQPDMNEVKWLIEHGDMTQTDSQKRTAFMIILGWGNDDLAKFALKHGAKPNQKGPGGNTAVHMVAASGNAALLGEMLLNANGDFTLRNDDGKTPYDLAQGRFPENILQAIRNEFDIRDPASTLKDFRRHIAERGLRTKAPIKAPPRAVFRAKP